jgi:hypothetical protein
MRAFLQLSSQPPCALGSPAAGSVLQLFAGGSLAIGAAFNKGCVNGIILTFTFNGKVDGC